MKFEGYPDHINSRKKLLEYLEQKDDLSEDEKAILNALIESKKLDTQFPQYGAFTGRYQGYYGLKGEKISFWDWMHLEESGERCIKQEDIDGFFISTVLIGHNMNFFEDQPPLIFETMTFDRREGKDENWSDSYMDRYATVEEALIGHEKARQWVINKEYETQSEM